MPRHVAWFVAVLPLSGMPTAGENLHQKMNEISFFSFSWFVLQKRSWNKKIGGYGWVKSGIRWSGQVRQSVVIFPVENPTVPIALPGQTLSVG